MKLHPHSQSRETSNLLIGGGNVIGEHGANYKADKAVGNKRPLHYGFVGCDHTVMFSIPPRPGDTLFCTKCRAYRQWDGTFIQEEVAA